jgi:hypothetical protein
LGKIAWAVGKNILKSSDYLTLARMKKPRLFNIDQCYRGYVTLAMVKKLRLLNPRHKAWIIVKNTCEEPKLFNPRHKSIGYNEG